MKQIKDKTFKMNSAFNKIQEEKKIIEDEIVSLTSRKKTEQEYSNSLKKETADMKKLYKKLEHEEENLSSQCVQLDGIIMKTEKMVEELRKESQALLIKKKNLEDDAKINLDSILNKTTELEQTQQEITKTSHKLTELDEDVQNLQEEETKYVEEIKFLSTIREKMARTASQAMAQMRETKEELKVKELLILDLSKKQQDTEFRLSSFIALYEEVKNQRNKYVSQIQDNSQDLAELKERIKILQNEVEILRNESSEKDRALVDIKHQVMKATYDRDSLKSELDKKNQELKRKQAVISQKVNEGDKLNLIINQLQKEMNDLIYKYEMACEHRNYMGIQLIDRNDELCILYEKANIQENTLKEGE
jgi:chromosome segregation ATPase